MEEQSTRSRRRVAVLAVAAFIVTAPAAAVGEEHPARFGWHMYSALKTYPVADVAFADGSTQTPDFESLVASAKVELDYTPALTRMLCARAGAVAVTVSRTQPALRETTACSR